MFNLRASATSLILTCCRFLLFLPHNIDNPCQAQGPCVCTNCPQFMPDGFTGQFYIQIQNADNPTLGQNGQGVCGVNLSFDHEYLGDLQITLTSPAGRTVYLPFGRPDRLFWRNGLHDLERQFCALRRPCQPGPWFQPDLER